MNTKHKNQGNNKILHFKQNIHRHKV